MKIGPWFLSSIYCTMYINADEGGAFIVTLFITMSGIKNAHIHANCGQRPRQRYPCNMPRLIIHGSDAGLRPWDKNLVIMSRTEIWVHCSCIDKADYVDWCLCFHIKHWHQCIFWSNPGPIFHHNRYSMETLNVTPPPFSKNEKNTKFHPCEIQRAFFSPPSFYLLMQA